MTTFAYRTISYLFYELDTQKQDYKCRKIVFAFVDIVSSSPALGSAGLMPNIEMTRAGDRFSSEL